MLEDALAVADGATLHYDVCIIGSGAAGITIAHQLLNSGKKVAILEGSLLDNRQPFTAADAEHLLLHETHPAPQGVDYDICDEHRFCDRTAQTLYEGTVSPEMEAIDPHFLTRSRIRVYGGTTNCWGGWTRPLAPEDFDRRDLDPLMVWPVSRAALEPFYGIALRYCSLPPFSPYRYDDAPYWMDKADRPLRALPQATGNVGTAVWTTMSNQGPGNPDGAWDFQIVWGPDLVRDPDTTLLRNANVRRIFASGGVVTGVGCTTIDYATGKPGQSFTVTADQFVLAAGGIETPRLLLLSGLQDRGGTLGRYFMVHPLNVGALYFRGADPGAEVRSWYSLPGPMLRSTPYPPRIFAALTPTRQGLTSARIGNIRAIAGFHQGGGGQINLNWEQIPDPGNAVVLSHRDDTDLFGDPRVRLEWRHTARDQHTLEGGARLVVDELRALGLLSSVTGTDLRVRQPGDHHMGTTRMSSDPATGYVDADCRVHHLRNLFIASSSVFPTSGYANPTLTIIALAARVAYH
ncbi:MAG: GMC family oxidoreductase, partial [Gemmatimonadetes bacterium]|nr:GMC family oxidoreductase [Gemmatimonadota bacterium]